MFHTIHIHEFLKIKKANILRISASFQIYFRFNALYLPSQFDVSDKTHVDLPLSQQR